MASIISENSIGADKQATLEISRQFNSNLSRAAISQFALQRFGQVDSASGTVDTLQTATLCHDSAGKSLILIVPLPPLGRKPRGLTGITISEADEKSVPPRGPELLNLVNKAKLTGKLPKICDSNVIRCVDGLWMAPQVCDSCQGVTENKRHSRRLACDRGFPCSNCSSAGSDCQRGLQMTLIGASIHMKHFGSPEIPKAAVESIGLILASPLHQNPNATWNSTVQGKSFNHSNHHPLGDEPPIVTPPRRTSARLASLLSAKNPPSSPKVGHSSSPKQAYGALSPILNGDSSVVPRGIKRKAECDQSRPSQLPVNSVAQQVGIQLPMSTQIPAEEPFRKFKPSAKRSVRFIKYHQSMQEDKKSPFGEPPVWADKRQSLCETLPYYRAYQSGAYMRMGTVRAFMCDKEVGPRDKFEEEILIARVGGGRTSDDQGGQMIQKFDQDRSAFGLGFERAKIFSQPVAIIAGQGNRISPSKLPHYYNVLDWFHVTDVWCETSGGFKCWMVRLEKIHLGVKSWWAAIDSLPLDPARDIHAVKTTSKCCDICDRTSKEIYNAGWACLNSSCRAYFDFGKEIDDALLDYNELFMKERTKFSGVIREPLVPALLTNMDIEMNNGFGVENVCKTGIVCPLCKGCSRRIEWDHWRCETPGCPFTHKIRQNIMRVHDAIAAGFKLGDEYFEKKCGIQYRQYTLGMYDVFEYSLPGPQKDEVVGIIRQFRANGIINGQPDGPNDLFRFMQNGNFGLKRHPARQKGSTGEILTSHWAANWGAPYKFGVSVASKAFDEAPLVIIKALKRLTWAGEQTVDTPLEPFHPFNELLSLGYFENTAIGYHDDGEKELGPTVATLSLGSQAMMTLRPKAKSSIGEESKNTKGTKKDVLKLILLHGDLVVMHGPGIQKFYEHAVTPNGKLRFALTCRYVRPELMASDEERRQTEINAKLPNGHEQYNYDGDLNKQLVLTDDGPQNVSEAQRAINQLAGRALAGDLDIDTLRQCQRFLHSMINRMAV